MESTADAMKSIIDKFLKIVGKCPHCGAPLYAYKATNRDGSQRCAPVCMECKYTENNKDKNVKSIGEYDIQMDAMKSESIKYFKQSSVLNNRSMLSKTLDTYEVNSEKQAKALQVAKNFCRSFAESDKVHSLLSGTAGAGKTHLSVGMVYESMRQKHWQRPVTLRDSSGRLSKSSRSMKCIFVNFPELVRQTVIGYHDDDTFRKISVSLVSDMAKADIVVLDDVGTESGLSNDETAKKYVKSLLYSIVDARQDKALIVTTNLKYSTLTEMYDEQIISRITSHAANSSFKFENMADYRLTAK